MEKRSLYTYRRKKDGHLYFVSYTHSDIVKKSDAFMNMAINPFWETVKVEKHKTLASVSS